MKKYICVVCEYIYDPELGDPESGIEPGTAFEDIPEDWVCPLCGVGKKTLNLTRNKRLCKERSCRLVGKIDRQPGLKRNNADFTARDDCEQCRRHPFK